ncbi:MAG TPA: hypothetical protein VIL74_07820 [Pyrinomonadaceae bacterium]
MNRKTIIGLVLISGLVSALTASLVVFALVRDDAARAVESPSTIEKPAPTPTERVPLPPDEEIKAPDVESLTIETVYKNFFAEDSKCRRNYQEYFKDSDGVASSSSPCNAKLTFGRDGSAVKTIEVRRYDRAAKEWRVIEKESWQGRIADAQFNDLANTIVDNEAFKNWNDRVLINVSNCKITVEHKKGKKSPMSNVDASATAYLPMVSAFKDLDAKVGWQRIE